MAGWWAAGSSQLSPSQGTALSLFTHAHSPFEITQRLSAAGVYTPRSPLNFESSHQFQASAWDNLASALPLSYSASSCSGPPDLWPHTLQLCSWQQAQPIAATFSESVSEWAWPMTRGPTAPLSLYPSSKLIKWLQWTLSLSSHKWKLELKFKWNNEEIQGL